MKCKVMGIVNVTPDSFSDGGRYFEPKEAVRRARNLIEDGADIIDFGGESTRPGATPLGWEEEWKRLEPVLAGLGVGGRNLAKDRTVLVSVDTYHPETAARAIAAGADIINCVYAEPIPEMAKLLAGNAVELVLPPSALAQIPDAQALLPRLYLDPMIGFGTTREEDVALLRSVPELAQKGRVLIGASRKRLVKQLTGDFQRQFPVIHARNGAAAHEADFRQLKGHLDRAEPMTRDFIGQMDALFGQQITPAQRKVMFMGLTQGGFMPFVALVGVGGEHLQAQVDIRREDDGALIMTYSSMPDAAIEARYSYRVEPDGTSRRVGDLVSRRREQPVEG